MPFVPISGPIVNDTVYAENQLVAKDCDISLPEIAATLAEVRAMGKMSLPIWQMLEDMEATITKIGVDNGLAKMLKPEPMTIEIRFVYIKIDADNSQTNIGCKVFLRCVPKAIPSAEIKVGESIECEVPLSVSRYEMIVDGQEQWLIDRLAGICRVDGKDYAQDIESML